MESVFGLPRSDCEVSITDQGRLQLLENWPMTSEKSPLQGVSVRDPKVQFWGVENWLGQTSTPWGLTHDFWKISITGSRCSWPQSPILRCRKLTRSDFNSMRTDPWIFANRHYSESVFGTPRSDFHTWITDTGQCLISQEVNGCTFQHFLRKFGIYCPRSEPGNARTYLKQSFFLDKVFGSRHSEVRPLESKNSRGRTLASFGFRSNTYYSDVVVI